MSTTLHIENNSPFDPPLAGVGNAVVFISDDAGGEQIWGSDGTSSGTLPLGPYNGYYGRNYFPPSFTTLGNRLLFRSYSSTTGPTLYATDGTVSGTVSLNSPGPYGPIPVIFGAAGTFAYFASSTQIYRTDGTPTGTVSVPGPPNVTNTGDGTYHAVAGDATGAYFGLNLAQFQYSVVRYDLTLNTSTVLASSSVQPPQLLLSAGHLFFSLSTTSTGAEPWVSDGTPAGTAMLVDIAPEPTQGSSNPGSFFAFQNQLYFTATDGVSGQALWHSDGTTAGTQPVPGLTPTPLNSTPQDLFAAGNSLMFFAKDTTNTSSYLWSYDPTSGSATEIPSAGLPFTCGPIQPPTVATLNGITFFPAAGPDAIQPWRSDGTVAGTTLLANLTPGGYGSGPCSLVTVGNKIFFIANGIGAQSGNWLWTSDGTSAGTVRLAQIGPDAPAGPGALLGYAGSTYYIGPDSSNTLMLWRTDGTPQGTVLASSLPDPQLLPLGVVNNKLLFRAPDNGQGPRLWVFDPTTAAFTTISQSFFFGFGRALANASLAFFTASDPTTQVAAPWVTDGTSGGTHELLASDGSFPASVQWLGEFHNTMIYVGADSQGTSWYWKSDGTVAGTTPLAPLGTGQSVSSNTPTGLTAGNSFFFAVTDPIIGSELYALDNQAPLANPDTGTVVSGQSVTLPVLTNDNDPDGSINPSTVTIVTAPAHGTATVGSDGTITYTPAAGFSGTDTFTYSVQDKQGMPATTPATVTLQISPSPSSGSGGSGSDGGGSTGGGSTGGSGSNGSGSNGGGTSGGSGSSGGGSSGGTGSSDGTGTSGGSGTTTGNTTGGATSDTDSHGGGGPVDLLTAGVLLTLLLCKPLFARGHPSHRSSPASDRVQHQRPLSRSHEAHRWARECSPFPRYSLTILPPAAPATRRSPFPTPPTDPAKAAPPRQPLPR